MEFKDFIYVKPGNKTSERTMLVLASPSSNYFGIDMSDMITDDFHNFSEKYNELHRNYKQAVQKLMTDYDLTHNYRQFDPQKMQDVTTYYGWDD